MQWKYYTFYGDWVLFFQVEAFQFSKFHEDVAKLDKSNLRETWTWHSRPKISKITGKSGLKFCKLIFITGNWANCLQIVENISETEKCEKVLKSRKDCWKNFLSSERPILLYYFHQKILKEKTAILENITHIFCFCYFLWYHDLSLYKKACLHNLCMNRALLDRESLDRVSWTSTTRFIYIKAQEHEHIFSKYSSNLIKNILF